MTPVLRRINTGPYDPRLRLDYARRIKRTQPALAEFIEQQVWLAENEKAFDDPKWLRYSRLASQAERSRGSGWVPEQLAKAGVTSVDFRAGFVEHVKIDAQRLIRHADEVFDCAPIRHLTVTGAKGHIEDLLEVGRMERVISLDLGHNALDDSDVAAFAGARLPELLWLSLAANEITIAGVRALAHANGLAGLRYVDLDANPCDPSDRLSYDEGVLIDAWRTREGAELENEVGHPIAWLRRDASNMSRFSSAELRRAANA